MAYVTNQPPDVTTSNQETIYPPPAERQRGFSEERHEDRHEAKVTSATLTGGASLEVLGGGAAVVLAIIGLTGFMPFYMVAIAVIVIGGALLAYSAAVAARWSDTVARFRGSEEAEVAAGIGTELIGGAAGIALGILALAGVYPQLLLPIAAIVFGGSLLIGGMAQPQLSVTRRTHEHVRTERISKTSMDASGGVMALAGVGALVLGVLALIGVGPFMTLILVAMLGLGGGLLLAGAASAVRFGHMLREAR